MSEHYQNCPVVATEPPGDESLCTCNTPEVVRKLQLHWIREDLGKALGESVPGIRAYHLYNAVSRLAQLVEDLHDLG
jgi:hypothetical protein